MRIALPAGLLTVLALQTVVAQNKKGVDESMPCGGLERQDPFCPNSFTDRPDQWACLTTDINSEGWCWDRQEQVIDGETYGCCAAAKFKAAHGGGSWLCFERAGIICQY